MEHHIEMKLPLEEWNFHWRKTWDHLPWVLPSKKNCTQNIATEQRNQKKTVNGQMDMDTKREQCDNRGNRKMLTAEPVH